jgi:tRNA1(Val) A37 N6-methylase TrmN6
MNEEVSDDGFLNGRLKLLQPKRGHRFGGDAALLVAAARSVMEERAAVADFGSGVGPVGLGLARFGAGTVALVEIDPALAAIAAQNAVRNGFGETARAVVCDVASLCRPGAPHEVSPESLDLVAANPPFDDAGRFRASPDASKALAHRDDGLFCAWTSAAARALKDGGVFVVIQRPEALAEILAALDQEFGDIHIKPIQPKDGAPAARVLVSARKSGRGPLALLPPLVMHGADGRFTPEADAAQRGEAVIRL